MNVVEKIKEVLESGILLPEMTILPGRGATDAEIQQEEALLGHALCADHVAILRQWNGISLEVIRLYGAGPDTGEVGRISRLQVPVALGISGAVVVGSDAAGFAYLQAEDGRVYSYDSDGGEVKLMADSVEDLIFRVVFGRDAAKFAGDEWLQELIDAGVVE